jgi:4-diphosphocytidyl-2-C-methyl-D-erythritol kinase
LRLSAPAKINLFLKVTKKRADGYHELCSLICPVGLFDTIELAIADGEAGIRCDHPSVPEDETNLALRAARVFYASLESKNVKIGGQPQIHIDKRIPVGAGLGGGSSDAAAILKGLNHLLNAPFTTSELAALGLTLGADVPFFIYARPAIATGIGEILESYVNIPSYHILLVYPGLLISTAEVYKSLNLGLTKCEKKISSSLFKYRKFEASAHLCNDLETVTCAKYPVIEKVKTLLCNLGAHGALMSGSGSTVFGLFRDLERARKAAEELARNRNWQVHLVDPLN